MTGLGSINSQFKLVQNKTSSSPWSNNIQSKAVSLDVWFIQKTLNVDCTHWVSRKVLDCTSCQRTNIIKAIPDKNLTILRIIIINMNLGFATSKNLNGENCGQNLFESTTWIIVIIPPQGWFSSCLIIALVIVPYANDQASTPILAVLFDAWWLSDRDYIKIGKRAPWTMQQHNKFYCMG